MGSADSAVISPPALTADVRLASIASSGEFQPPPSPNEPGGSEDLYVVVEGVATEREDFLSVKKGQVRFHGDCHLLS